MPSLAGLHDIESTAIAPPDTWLLDTIALSENPPPRSYPSSLNIIARINYGYGSTGTLPNSNQYNAFAASVAAYVAGSQNCRRWIIGNETNLSREWPNSAPIYPWHYAACFKLCRDAIHALAGHERDEVLVAASGPWNDECKYEGNPNGDWITYFADVLGLLEGELDGFSLHSYTHGYNVNLVTDTSRMNSPFQNRYYNFLTYRDYCDAIPLELSHLPAYITEANGNGPWQAVGLMPAMLGEIDWWNRSNNAPLISSVAFYRYPHYDDFYIEGRADVIAEYNAAVQRGYLSPSPDGGQSPIPEPPPDPQPPTPDPEPPTPDVEWDPRLTTRGCELTVVESAEGQTVWRCTHGEWFDEAQAQGRVNTYVTLLDENGQLITGVPVKWYWTTGEEMRVSEIKNDPWLGHPYSLDFAMYNVAPSYGLLVADSNPSDDVWGMGLGSIEQPHYKIHTAYSFVFQRVKNVTPEPPIPPGPATIKYVTALAGANLRAEPVTGAILVAVPYGDRVNVYGSVSGDDGYLWDAVTYLEYDGFIRSDLLSATKPQPPEPPQPADRTPLIWPCHGRVTQWFGEGGPQFSQPAHAGVDIAVPVSTPIRAIANGRVVRTSEERDYGLFVRVWHPQIYSYSRFAHLSEIKCFEGQEVTQGEVVALSGNTGNSTGPHTHFEMQGCDEAGNYVDVTYGYLQGRYDPRSAYLVTGSPLAP